MARSDKETEADVLNNEQYKKIFSARRKEINGIWDGYTERVIDESQSQIGQIARNMEAHMLHVLGRKYTIGWFLETDIGSREIIGYIPLGIGFFPNDERNKPTWTDNIARSLNVHNHADGTIRWGSRDELIACIIPTEIRQKYLHQKQQESERVMDRHVGEGVQTTTNEYGTSETQTVIREKGEVMSGALNTNR